MRDYNDKLHIRNPLQGNHDFRFLIAKNTICEDG